MERLGESFPAGSHTLPTSRNFSLEKAVCVCGMGWMYLGVGISKSQRWLRVGVEERSSSGGTTPYKEEHREAEHP